MEPAGQNWPGLHACGVVDAGLAQKLPSGQVAQVMLAVVVHSDVAYWPRAQVPHVVQTEALDTDAKLVPVTHGVQTASEDEVQNELVKEPEVHTLHDEGLVTPAAQKLLAGHAILVEALGQKNPAGQVCGSVRPGIQKLPGLHAILVTVFGQYDPRGHRFWLMEPAGQKLGETHGVWVCVVLQKLPAWHVALVVEPSGQKVESVHGVLVLVVLQKWPAGHLFRLVEFAGQKNVLSHWMAEVVFGQ
jgi:hypothetical protein